MARNDIGPRRELNDAALLNDHVANFPVNIFVYIHRSMMLSTLIRKTLPCHGLGFNAETQSSSEC